MSLEVLHAFERHLEQVRGNDRKDCTEAHLCMLDCLKPLSDARLSEAGRWINTIFYFLSPVENEYMRINGVKTARNQALTESWAC